VDTADYRRVVLIVLDGAGAGALPDAAEYGDEGANTLLHVAQSCGGLHLPVLERLGLGNILSLPGIPPARHPAAAFGRMSERSAGKDTVTGHWEIAGLIQEEPLPTFPEGFPPEIIEAFRQQTGFEPLGNVAASGTEILRLLGEEHLATSRPIVYTSVDSVFQIAAHEKVIPVEQLYQLCRTTRRILDPYRVCRVIARPFEGSRASDFRRTSRRKDFSLPPPGKTLLDKLQDQGVHVIGIGKIGDIFAGRGIDRSIPTKSNADGVTATLRILGEVPEGLIFTNLVDFDMLFGHRRDARGFGRALEKFDAELPRLMASLKEDDLLVITADHGCDPTARGTDHTREHVPLLVWSKKLSRGRPLGSRSCFCDIAATIAEALGISFGGGRSFLRDLED